MTTIQSLSVSALKEAIHLKEQIESLGSRLSQLLGGGETTRQKPGPKKGSVRRGRRTMSASARAKIAAAQRARWAKSKGKSAATAAPVADKAVAKRGKKGRKRSGLTPEGRAKLAAAMKARWAARRKGGAAPNAASSK